MAWPLQNRWVRPVVNITIIPRCSMYGIFIYIWVIYRVNVGKYSIHGASGYRDGVFFSDVSKKKETPTNLCANLPRQVHRSQTTFGHLVGGIPTPPKNMTSSIGMIFPFPTEWKHIKSCSSHQQPDIQHPNNFQGPSFFRPGNRARAPGQFSALPHALIALL